jgi:hypothetical protein
MSFTHPSSTNSTISRVSGSIIAGGILAIIISSAGILFAAFYFLVSSIYVHFCTIISYNFIRGSLLSQG